MSWVQRRLVLLGILIPLVMPAVAPAKGPVPAAREFVPDPASVQRLGPAYRYPQAGWIVLHIEGEPYERGYQHGKLMAAEIADYVQALATFRGPKAPADAWRDQRLLVNALFLRRYDKEYLEEMKGIADGAAAGGAKFDNRPLDLLDIVAVNSGIELDFLESNLAATATGLEGLRFKEPLYARPKRMPPAHCSAFVANGPATADGQIVFGHITMWTLYPARHYNLWLDVKPSKGQRILMQSFPGGILSGLDYYMNDAGLLVAETTIPQTKFDINGMSLCSRIRKALQYGRSIDEAVHFLKEANNGVYSNEWLLADTKTNEIALFELGTHKSRLWRSAQDDWIAGTKGFYWGCNNAKDLQVRLETLPSVADKPANLVFCPSSRDQTWIRLYEKHKGQITAAFGFEAFTTPPVAAYPSLDAKFTTTALAKELKTWALFGPPLGRTWEPTPAERTRYPDIQPLVSNDWALLHAKPPGTADGAASPAVDLAARPDSGAADDPDEAEHPDTLSPAWHGTLLPKTDADVWLAAAFAEYERIVALEKALKARAKDDTLSADDQDRLALALFAPRSRYLTAVQRWQKDVPLAQTRSDLRRDEWYDIAVGKGVLLLAELRSVLGEKVFEQLMDDFGRAHAGQEVTTAQFCAQAAKAHGKPLDDFFGPWLRATGLPGPVRGGSWSILSFEEGLERVPGQALIVYGTHKEKHAQREAAELLQRQILRRGSNYTVPIKTDQEVTAADLKSHHLLLIGRPDTNAVAARVAQALPVTFGPGSFELRGKVYANPASAVIAAGANPLNPRYSVVAFAGLSAEATRRSAQQLGDGLWWSGSQPAPEVLLLAAGSKPKRLTVPAPAKAVSALPGQTPPR
jgi:hypothetical protein